MRAVEDRQKTYKMTSLMKIHKDIERAKPIYKAIKALTLWYQKNPQTPASKAQIIADLHEVSDKLQAMIEKRQAEELMPKLQSIKTLNEEIRQMGKDHQKENEDMAILFATTELQYLKDEISELPQTILELKAKVDNSDDSANTDAKI